MRTGARTLRSARRLRRGMTPPEVRLWRRLQLREPGAPRWRRQHPLGPWVLDFYCPDAKRVVEVDGWGHNKGDQPARDERRDAWLTARGSTVVRVTAAEVMADADGVADGLIRQAAALGQPPPSRR